MTGNLLFIYIGDGQWHRFDLEGLETPAFASAAWQTDALAEGHEVES
jgi:hypothetical protein